MKYSEEECIAIIKQLKGEKELQILIAEINSMTMPERLHRYAQIVDFDKWMRVAKEWLTSECLSSGKDKLCS